MRQFLHTQHFRAHTFSHQMRRALAVSRDVCNCPLVTRRFFCRARSADSNAGAATPYSLYKLYSKQAAATANPYTLRQVNGGLNMSSLVGRKPIASTPPPQRSLNTSQVHLLMHKGAAAAPTDTNGAARQRDDSPPRAAFKLLAAAKETGFESPRITLSLRSLRS